MKTFLTTLALGALLSPVAFGAEMTDVGTFDVEIGLLDEKSEMMHVTFYGSRDADPRVLLAKEDTSVVVGDFNRDGFEDVAFMQVIEEVSKADDDDRVDIVTAPGAGGGPHVKVFNAYPGFSGGVRVAVGDVTGDGAADIVVGAGAGGGPHVKVFNVRTIGW